MRAVLLGCVAVLALSPRASGQHKKPSPAVAVESARPRMPAVFWKRGMTAPPRRDEFAVPNPPPAVAPAETAQPAASAEPRVPKMRAEAPVLPVPPRAPERDGLLHALDTIQAGASRETVIAKLGRPAYSIGIPDGDHMIERCRFRLGAESVAAIEFRDGVAARIERTPQ